MGGLGGLLQPDRALPERSTFSLTLAGGLPPCPSANVLASMSETSARTIIFTLLIDVSLIRYAGGSVVASVNGPAPREIFDHIFRTT